MIDWIKVRGVRWVRLETDAIEFEEGMHEFRSVNSGIVLLKDRKEPATY